MRNLLRPAIIVALVVVSAGAAAYVFRGRLFSRDRAMAMPAAQSPSQSSAETPRASIDIDARRQQLIGVRTVAVERTQLADPIRAVGVVKYDETRQADVNVKLDGWIRDLFVDYTGRPFRRGERLFTLFSPQLLAAENEYVLALQTRDQMQHSQIMDARERADALVAAARQRLALWDVPAADLDAIERDRRARDVMTVVAPVAGFVAEKQAVRGMHVTPGESLYKIADISAVWIEADVYETEIAAVRVGQAATVTLDAYPGERLTGRVVYIYPYVDEQTRTNKVRYAFANPNGRLKPGMFANVELRPAARDALVVPTDAVLDSGKEQVVFVAEGSGRFEPRHVRIGRRSAASIEVLEGLKEGEQVAAGAAFFLDSESQLRGSLQAFETPAAQPRTASETQLDIALRTIPDPPRMGENQFEVSAKDAAGNPIAGADVSVEFFMAAMPTMNMPAMRNVVKLEPARAVYRGTGQVQTSGRWTVTVTVTRQGERLGSKQLTVVVQ